MAHSHKHRRDCDRQAGQLEKRTLDVPDRRKVRVRMTRSRSTRCNGLLGDTFSRCHELVVGWAALRWAGQGAAAAELLRTAECVCACAWLWAGGWCAGAQPASDVDETCVSCRESLAKSCAHTYPSRFRTFERKLAVGDATQFEKEVRRREQRTNDCTTVVQIGGETLSLHGEAIDEWDSGTQNTKHQPAHNQHAGRQHPPPATATAKPPPTVHTLPTACPQLEHSHTHNKYLNQSQSPSPFALYSIGEQAARTQL
jgi:hypothetical protein